MPTPQEVISDLILGIDHVGIAVQNLDKAITNWETNFGAKLHSREINPEQGVEEALLKFTDGSKIQLLAALTPDSAIGKFLAKHGEGIQQLALRVSNLEMATLRLSESKINSVYESGKSGSNEIGRAHV